MAVVFISSGGFTRDEEENAAFCDNDRSGRDARCRGPSPYQPRQQTGAPPQPPGRGAAVSHEAPVLRPPSNFRPKPDAQSKSCHKTAAVTANG